MFKKHGEENIENKVVTEIQKIRKVDTSVQINNQVAEEESDDVSGEKDTELSKAEIQNIKNFLIEEYGVNEKCLEIN